MNSKTAMTAKVAVPTQSDSSMQPPFTVDQLKEDICTIVLLELRKLDHLFGDSSGWESLGIAEEDVPAAWRNPSYSAQEIGLTFDKVEDTAFADIMLDHFDHGFLALRGTRSETMDWDSAHTYIAAYLIDLGKSVYVEEWEGEGVPDLQEAIGRCLHTVKISNARRALEGHEPFCNKFSASSASSEDATNRNELSIAQLAMLAGVEEVSLRSSISRKTPPLLTIEKDDRRTFIKSDVARQWLKAKGRYLPVRGPVPVELDLSRTAFTDDFDLARALRVHAEALFAKDPASATKLSQVLAAHGATDLGELVACSLDTPKVLTDIAQALALQPNLLVFRAKEALVHMEIQDRERLLKDLSLCILEASS